MTQSHNSTFASPELQKAVDDVRPLLEGAEEAKSRVSNDIKALEKYLQSLNLKHAFRHEIGCSQEIVGDDAAISLEYSGTASAIQKQEVLIWGPDPKGTFRLLYEINSWDGSIDVDLAAGPYFWDESSHRRESKPLIESSFDIRKRVYQDHLSDFVKRLGEDLRVERKSKPAEQDKIPF